MTIDEPWANAPLTAVLDWMIVNVSPTAGWKPPPTDATSVLPPMIARPDALSASYCVPNVVPLRSIRNVPPRNTPPTLWLLRMPGPLKPGASVAPPPTPTSPVVPVPPRTAPLLTDTLLLGCEPLMNRVPAFTNVGAL